MMLGLHAAHRRPARIGAGLALLMMFALSFGSVALGASSASSRSLYIVQMAGAPIAAYTGDVKGFKATKPAAGKKVDVQSAVAKAYAGHLKADRNTVLGLAGLGTRATVYTYDVAFNGFAMKLTAAEATRLERTSGVAHVWKDEIYTTDTVSTPSFLGLDGSSGVWNQQFGGSAHAGEGVIVGVLDTGFWPESPSFAPLPEPRPDAATIAAKWHGICDPGSDPNVANRVTCNNKVIGARWYDAGGLSSSVPDEFLSPRDRNLHGSHTASTAAGDQANAVINGVSVGTASGMAPAARLAIYKIGWHQPDGTASGSTADIVAAIDDAIADGVDVINLSFSGSLSFIVDPVEIDVHVRRGRRRLHGRVSGEQRAGGQHRRAQLAVGHDRRGKHARPVLLAYRHARQWRDLHRSWRRSRPCLLRRSCTRATLELPAPRRRRCSVLQRLGHVHARRPAGARPGEGRRQDRRVRPRRQRPHRQELRGEERRRRRHDPR